MSAATERQRAAVAEFTLALRSVANLPAEQGGKLVRAVASDIGEALVVGNDYGPGTPVDKGFARGSWYTSKGDGNASANPNPIAMESRPREDGTAGRTQVPAMSADSLTQQGVDNVLLGAATMQLGDVLNFVNDAAYIERLNDGYSGQAPQGMTDSIVSNFDVIVERNAARLGVTGPSSVDPMHSGAGGES